MVTLGSPAVATPLLLRSGAGLVDSIYTRPRQRPRISS
jgi:hypothetical protein